ncbi:MAG TPA: hypothetical protein VJ440_13315 [Candidatus Brocadiaceae bacterium]|nr:hypothetical protein [Candidatus Brocadiaceae bacterium]
MPKQLVGEKRLQLMSGFSFCVVFHGESPRVKRQGLRQIKSCETTDFLARQSRNQKKLNNRDTNYYRVTKKDLHK